MGWLKAEAVKIPRNQKPMMTLFFTIMKLWITNYQLPILSLEPDCKARFG
jgi:hypothetical protein